MDAAELSNRLESLERQTRRMKRAGLVVVGVGLAVALIGATTPEEIPEALRARSFYAVDEDGKTGVLISGSGSIWVLDEKRSVVTSPVGIAVMLGESQRSSLTAEGITYTDESGNMRSRMNADGFFSADENGKTRAAVASGGIVYSDENGNVRVGMGASGFSYFDENTKERSSIDADGFHYRDENGKTRAQLGVVETVAQKTGQESRFPAGVALFDDDGNLIWMAPD